MCDCPSFRLASRRRTGVPLIGLLASLFFSTHALAAESPPPIVPLFNGKTLDGWTAYAREPAPAAQNLFEVIDGTLHAYPNAKDGSTQPIGYVVTNAEYANYRLSLEYKWGTGKFVPRAEPDMARDAGVLFHVHSPDTIWPAGAECQIQEGDTGDAWLVHTRATSRVHPDTMGYWPAGHANGVAVTKGEVPNVYRRFLRYYCHEQPGWNHVEVVARGDQATYYVNGHLVNEVTALKRWDEGTQSWQPLTKGRILLQAEGAEIYYRNVTIQALDAPAAN